MLNLDSAFPMSPSARRVRVWRGWPSLAVLLAALTFAQTTPAAAQTAQAAGMQKEIAAMRDELSRLRAEVDALKQALAVRPATPDAAAVPALVPDAAATAAKVAVVESQVQELAQTKVESASRLPVKLFGTIVSNTFFNSGEANWLENPNLVNRFAGVATREGSFSSTLRQTRLGVSVETPASSDVRASGVVVMDFFGGTPGFVTGSVMGLPRLLYAFARVDGKSTSLEVGQDTMMLAPRDPTSLAAQSFPDLFRAGNLYLRVPQARVEQKLGKHFTAMGGIIAPIAGDFNEDFYVFVPLPGAGERSRMPAFQGHFGFKSTSEDETHEAALGVSGHYGRERHADTTDKTWAAAVDFNLQAGKVGASGEFFHGENIDQFGGALGQEASSSGGWAEARLAMTRRLAVTGGFGLDRLPEGEFLFVPRRENRSVFSNVIFKVTPELSTSVEYRWLQTLFSGDERRENHHVNWVFAYSF
jgi:hypothetical protein